MPDIIEVQLFGHAGAKTESHTININKSTRPKSAIPPLARLLQKDSVPEDTLLHIVRDDVSVFVSDLPIAYWAAIDYVDNQTQAARKVKYTEHFMSKKDKDDADET